MTNLTVNTTSLCYDHYRYCQFLILPLHFNCFCRQKYYFSLSVGFHLTYIVIIGGEATQNCDMDNWQPRQSSASNGEAVHGARDEEITPSVAGVRRKNNTAPERRSTRRRGGGLPPGCSTGPAAFNVAGGRNKYHWSCASFNEEEGGHFDTWLFDGQSAAAAAPGVQRRSHS